MLGTLYTDIVESDAPDAANCPMSDELEVLELLVAFYAYIYT